jgi:hypothetical protein
MHYIKHNLDSLPQVTDILYDNEDFFAVLENAGWEELIDKLPSKIRVKSREELQIYFISAIDKITQEDGGIKSQYFETGQNRMLLWIINHCDEYLYYGYKAQELYNKLKNTHIDYGWSIVDISKSFEELMTLYSLFCEMIVFEPVLIRTRAFCFSQNYIYPLRYDGIIVRCGDIDYIPYACATELKKSGKIDGTVQSLLHDNDFVDRSFDNSIDKVSNYKGELLLRFGISQGELEKRTRYYGHIFIVALAILSCISSAVLIYSSPGKDSIDTIVSAAGMVISITGIVYGLHTGKLKKKKQLLTDEINRVFDLEKKYSRYKCCREDENLKSHKSQDLTPVIDEGLQNAAAENNIDYIISHCPKGCENVTVRPNRFTAIVMLLIINILYTLIEMALSMSAG